MVKGLCDEGSLCGGSVWLRVTVVKGLCGERSEW